MNQEEISKKASLMPIRLLKPTSITVLIANRISRAIGATHNSIAIPVVNGKTRKKQLTFDSQSWIFGGMRYPWFLFLLWSQASVLTTIIRVRKNETTRNIYRSAIYVSGLIPKKKTLLLLVGCLMGFTVTRKRFSILNSHCIFQAMIYPSRILWSELDNETQPEVSEVLNSYLPDLQIAIALSKSRILVGYTALVFLSPRTIINQSRPPKRKTIPTISVWRFLALLFRIRPYKKSLG